MDPNAVYTLHGTAVVSTLDGVTTVLATFVFVCLIFPSLVKNRAQYYAALVMVVLIILLHALTLILNKVGAFIVPAGVFTGLLQVGALVLLVLSVGGLTARQLAGDMARAYEVMRRGETSKEVIIPIGENQAGRGRDREDEPRTVYHIDSGQTPGRPEGSGQGGGERDEGIPLS